MTMRRLLPVYMLGMALMVACGQGPSTEGPATTTPSTVASTSSQPSTTTTEGDVNPPDTSDPTEAAIIELSRRLLVTRDQIEVVEARQVTWPDGSLGCPEEGMVYTQATVEGTQVLLRVDDRVFDYRAGDDGSAFLCASDEKDGGYDFVPPPGYDL
jgi:hypothetical protein